MKDKQEVCQVGKQQQDYIPGRQNSMCRGTRQGLYSQIKKKRGGDSVGECGVSCRSSWVPARG
jgi:hypothetical protein